MTSRTAWTVGTAGLAMAAYALLWVGYVSGWAWLAALDSSALDVAYRYGSTHHGWVTGWYIFCTALGPGAFRVAGVVVVVVLLVRRHWRAAGFVVLTVEASGILTQLAKAAADRPRPATQLVAAASTSFPSGHALGVTVSVLALLAMAWPTLRPGLRPWLLGVGVVVIVAIGVGRVVLNVHHPSDVLAGWALGYAYVVACWLLLPPWGRVSDADETPPAPDSAR